MLLSSMLVNKQLEVGKYKILSALGHSFMLGSLLPHLQFVQTRPVTGSLSGGLAEERAMDGGQASNSSCTWCFLPRNCPCAHIHMSRDMESAGPLSLGGWGGKQAQRDPTCEAWWPWQAQRLREPGSLLDRNEEQSILYLFYLKSKQFLLCLMSKRFHKLGRENMTHLVISSLFSWQQHWRSREVPKQLPHTHSPSCLEVATGLEAAPGQA